MRKGTFSYKDLVDPMILKILKISNIPMTTLSISYHVNQRTRKTINLKVIKSTLTFLVNNNKISEKIDKENGIGYYKLTA